MENFYDEFEEMDFETNEKIKEQYRKSRRSKRKEKFKNENQKKSINRALGTNLAKSCKKTIHKQNRKYKDDLVYINTKGKNTFKTVLYKLT